MSDTSRIEFFLGANSPSGFYSLYDHLLPPETASAIYILKGGPGCGKSTLMRKVAARLYRRDDSLLRRPGFFGRSCPSAIAHRLGGRHSSPCGSNTKTSAVKMIEVWLCWGTSKSVDFTTVIFKISM